MSMVGLSGDTLTHRQTQPITEDRPSMGPVLKILKTIPEYYPGPKNSKKLSYVGFKKLWKF